MISKNQISFISSLKQKKYRMQHKRFVAEGKKTILELLNSKFKLDRLYTTTLNFEHADVFATQITPRELQKVSFLKSPNEALAIFEIPENQPIDYDGLIVALDDVRDPGNLGTIIRLCDWFGVMDLICSPETVDCYNPKVVQASMGSIARVNITYLDLGKLLASKSTINKFGSFMDGENIYDLSLPDTGIIVFGNEATGISQTVSAQVTKKIAIPRFGDLQETESLNVANATAIILSEFRRSSIEK
jgi:TrmH family RNA methyltransferase